MLFWIISQRHARKEVTGLKSLSTAKIDAPDLIDEIHLSGFSLITTSFLENCQSLDALWKQNLSDESRLQLLERAIETIATLHSNHILHNDPHLDNFLINKDRIFLIDGGGLSPGKKTITPEQALKNLALFLSVLFPKHVHLSLLAFPYYQVIAPLPNVNEQHLVKAIKKNRKWRERYLEKIFRTCTDFIAESNFNHFQVIDRSEDSSELRRFIQSPDAYIYKGKLLKEGKTNTVSIVTLDDGKQVFVKRYKSKKGFIHKYVRGFRQSRARTAWYCAHHLIRLLGVDTPKPIALIEHRLGRFVSCSYLITEYVDADDALSYFTKQLKMTDEITEQAEKLLEIIESLKSGYFFHGDMKATNFILTRDRMMAIDLDQSKICPTKKIYQPLYEKDISRFQKNWVDSPIAKQLFALAGKQGL